MADMGSMSPSLASRYGTGYVRDGLIWGGEVLVCTLDGFERFAHIEYVPMPGGDAAVREPWRMALGHLHAAGLDVSSASALDRIGATEQEVRLLMRMIERQIHAPLTSSLGRLFDAAAAVILGRRKVDYEAQAAIELEGLAVDEPDDVRSYPIAIAGGDWPRAAAHLSLASMWHEMMADLNDGVKKSLIAARFHSSVVDGFVQAAVAARSATGIGRIAMSGGVMHNKRLSRLLRARLETQEFQVFQHRRVSPGDGGLSYGQAAVAAAILKKS
jgi:hydrogenase maturation protein HypF